MTAYVICRLLPASILPVGVFISIFGMLQFLNPIERPALSILHALADLRVRLS